MRSIIDSVVGGRLKKQPFLGRMLAAGLLLCLTGPAPASAQRTVPYSRACRFMPTPDLETHYGGKGSMKGTETQTLSTCSLTIAGNVVKVQAAQPGAKGLPTTIAAGLAGAKKMFGGEV